MSVTTIGIDCATDPRRVGLAFGRYEEGRTSVEEVTLGTRALPPVEVVAPWLRDAPGPVLLALDAPLGWPAPLGRALGSHRAGDPLEDTTHALFRRSTDRFVRERIGKQSLDVGADRIARTAHAALDLLSRLRKRSGSTVPLAWEPGFKGTAAIEVYPAATLRAHGIGARGYKKKGAPGVEARERVAAALGDRIALPPDRSLLRESDDALDAVTCLLAAQDFLLGDALPPLTQALAEREGWIWVRAPYGIDGSREG